MHVQVHVHVHVVLVAGSHGEFDNTGVFTQY